MGTAALPSHGDGAPESPQNGNVHTSKYGVVTHVWE